MSNWWPAIDIGIIQGLIFVSAVLGLGVSLRLLRFPDLTVEGSLMLGAASYASVRSAGGGFTIALLIALVTGLIAGSITATLHVYLRLNKFLAGILVIAATYSIALRVMHGSNISLLDVSSPFDQTASLNSVGLPDTHLGDILMLSCLAFGISTMMILLLRSRLGIRLRAVGCNPVYARTLGIPVSLYLITGIAVTNALASLSGMLLATYQGFSDVGMGQGILVVALASLALGERFTASQRLPEYIAVVIAAFVGSILYQLVIAAAIRMGLPPTDLKLATAVLVLFVVAVRMNKNEMLMEPI